MRKKSRTPARIAAVLGLITAVVVLLAIVSSQGDVSDEGTGPSDRTERQAERPKKPRKAAYVVKQGDTLLGIAADTGVSVTRLEELNPGLDPQRLMAGQRIKLR